MDERPLSEKMRRVLIAMLDLEEAGDWPSTPNEIADTCGYVPTMAKRGRSGRGHGTRVMGTAVHVTTTLTHLRVRGLVFLGTRRDHLSGSAYGLTIEGKAEARQALRDGLDANAAKAAGMKTEQQRDAELMARIREER